MNLVANLRRKLAEHGFESNEDYEFVLRCLFDVPLTGIRCLHVAGSLGRRKTAFAQALGPALEYAHRLYFDFTRPPPVPQLPEFDDPESDSSAPTAAPSALERVLIEACAYSEGGRTMLILDQLQASDFAEQNALARFVQTREWGEGDANVRAYARNLVLVLISESPLYHALQKASFRVNTDPTAGLVDYRPEDFGLPPQAQALLGSMAELFQQLGCTPTLSEMHKLLADLERRVRTIEQLRQALYGRMELVQLAQLQDGALEPALGQIIQQVDALLGIEQIALSADPSDA